LVHAVASQPGKDPEILRIRRQTFCGADLTNWPSKADLAPTSPVNDMKHDAEPRHHALARLAIAKRDIEQARTMAALVMDTVKTVNDPYFQALSNATVTAYSRPFLQTKTWPGLPQIFSKLTDPHLQAVHDDLVEARNGPGAQKDSDWNTDSSTPNRLAPFMEGGEAGAGQQGETVLQRRTLPLSCFPLIHQLCSLQIERLRKRIDLDTEIIASLKEALLTGEQAGLEMVS
jgi:hypothetical protein